jgi:hypothetical protein
VWNVDNMNPWDFDLDPDPSLIEGFGVTFVSFCLFNGIFAAIFALILKIKNSNDNFVWHLDMSNWIVSSLHAILATTVGISIVIETKHDLIYAR